MDMKKLLCVVCLSFMALSLWAQKDYVIIRAAVNGDSYSAGIVQYKTGNFTFSSDAYLMLPTHPSFDENFVIFRKAVDELVAAGFTIEQSNGYGFGTNADAMLLVFSRESSAAADVTNIQRVKPDDDADEEVHEVARYNLQGIPVRKNEKGVQIIVFSNYTTKTVIVE